MACAFCGEGDRWIKTCRALDGSQIRVCDHCWEVLSPWLVIVPGDGVVTARCQWCGCYFNLREMAEVSPGGRHSSKRRSDKVARGFHYPQHDRGAGEG